MGGILSLLLLLCMVFSGSVFGRQQEGDSVARRVRASWPSAFFQEALWVDDDAQPTDIPRRECKGKSSVAEVNSRCTKQQEVGTIKARPEKGISFSKGDWQQFPNAPPILPFNASDERQSGTANQLDPVHLASFSLTNFQGEGGRISGYLLLEITTSNNINDNRFHGFNNFSNDEAFQNGFHRFYNFSNDEAFQSQRGYSALKIDLEGLIHETKEEITLCMLGCTTLPSSLDSASLLEEDCNVMFQMQYPKKLSLTRSVIRAQVTSLLNAGEKHHFHPINVTALPPINRMPPYEYTVADVIDQICSNVTAETLAMEEDSFPGFALQRLFRYDFSVGSDVQPSLDCSKSEAFCDNMGPLGSTVGQGENLPHNALAIPVFRYTRISASEIHVSALLQFHHGGGGIVYHHRGASTLNDRTLVAEGLRKSETQQTCMVACPAEVVIANVSRDCNIRICLQFEAGLSLEKRSIISGTISSTLLNNESGAFNPLSFSMPLHRLRPLRFQVQGLSSYTFNHIEEARKFGEKFKLDNAQSTAKTTDFRYPTLHGNDSKDYIRLSEELSINSLLIHQSGRDQNLRFRFEVIAIGDHVTIGDESDMLLDTMVFSRSVLGRQQEGDSVARRVRVSGPSVIFNSWGDDDAQQTDILSREWKGKSSVEKVNSRCTKQEELGTVKAMPTKGLSFSKGGRWEQFPNAPQILPFNASDEQQSGAANQLDPVHLASFSLTNFQSRGGTSGKGAPGISGYLLLQFTTSNNINNNRFHGFYNFSNDEAFQNQRGYPALTIDLEGLMHETKEEITLCMLGCTVLPSSLDLASLLEEDCNVMFQMQCPKKLSLTRSIIHAQVTSLLNAGEKHHFHPINVTALPSISHMPPYEYSVADVIDQICSNVGAETLAMEEDSFPGFALQQLFHYNFSMVIDVQPSFDCSESKVFCDNMGPLGSTVGQGENLPRSTLAIPVFRYTRISVAEIDVSAVLQFHHGGGGGGGAIVYHDYGTFMLNNRTLLAEGLWKSETQQTCMVACPAEVVIANVSRDCNIRICLQLEAGLS